MTTMQQIINSIRPNNGEVSGSRFILEHEGKIWKVYPQENGGYKVYLGRCLEWETPTFISLKTWAQAKGLIGSASEQKEAKEYWSKKMAGWC